MHGQLQQAALTEADDLLETCDRLVQAIQSRGLAPEAGLRALTVHLGRLLSTADRAIGEDAATTWESRTFARHLRISLEELGQAIDECAELPPAETTFLGHLQGWLEGRIGNAGDTARVEALAQAWADLPPRVAGIRTCLRALDALLTAADLGVPRPRLERMTLAALHAFGPRLALALARTYTRSRVTNATLWAALETALDELAAWAAAPARHEPPEGFGMSALEVLLELAADETLSMWAVPRIPLHRLSRDQVGQLAAIIQERDRPQEDHELGEDAELCTGSLETAYLWAIEARHGRWPGMVW